MRCVLACNHCCSGKAIRITYSECEFSPQLPSLHSACAMSFVVCPAVYFPHYLINGTIFERKKSHWTQTVFLFTLQLLSEIFLILRKILRDVTTCVHRSWGETKHPIFLSDFNQTWIFFTDCRNILKYQIPWKSVQWVSNRQTDLKRWGIISVSWSVDHDINTWLRRPRLSIRAVNAM
jgi:hypothetical protein